jgi:predicted TIM-barrel fold metal-dependent hydrolase
MRTPLNCTCPRTPGACHAPDSGRRGLLTGLLGLGAAAFVPGCAAPAAPAAEAAALPPRIDTHHHFFSPRYVAELDKVGQAPPIVKNWTLNKTLDDMAKAGVATSMLSVTTPQASFTDAAGARRMARESNEHAARLGQDHKGKFGSFAMLPMQDPDSALRELEYALDTLKADGIGLLTSYVHEGRDKWLGDPQFAPVMDELNRRKAILYTHPTAANCCRTVLTDVPPTVIEFGTDTTRTITDIVFSGTAARCPDVQFIFSHAGGTLPFLTERFLKMPVLNPKLQARVPRGVLFELQRFHYDTAWSAHPGALASLMKLVKVSQVLFGSDYPYRTGVDHVKGLSDYGFSNADLRAIGRDNAVRLMPRWQA